jgi:site-specific DNA recombinase
MSLREELFMNKLENKNPTCKAVVYIRVSSLSQVDGHSLDAQERLFFDLCKNRGWQPMKIYREEGKSAHVDSIAKRPVFRQLLEDTAKNQFDLVVVHTLDRWARNLKVMLESFSILAKHNVTIASISENIDYSTPQGKLFIQMLGSFAEYFSGSLSHHVTKGMDQRAFEGRHVGGIPFGYESCWIEENEERKRRCNPEHQGGLHIHPKEGPAVTEIFKRYSSGSTTMGHLAVWLNDHDFRTRNTKKLPDASGNMVGGPRLFTSASVRWIIHNPFYTGKVPYKGKLLAGSHEPLVRTELFNLVQAISKKNCGRSQLFKDSPERIYLLKGIIRCAYCGMPMWAQTYHNGLPYYREHRYSRSMANCPSGSSSTACAIIDNQLGQLIESIELKPKWQEELLAILNLKDETARVTKERQDIQEKLRRMAKTYIDGLLPDGEYNLQKRLLEMQLESLVVPEINSAREAGELIYNLPKLWNAADLSQKRKLVLSMLDAVYIEPKQTKSIVAIKPKPPFRPIFQVAVSKKDADIRILSDSLKNSPVLMVETGEG